MLFHGIVTDCAVLKFNIPKTAMEENGEKFLILQDRLGSTNVLINESGQEVSYTEYKPFGSIKSEISSKPFSKKFTGQELDASTGLYDYDARQYSAEIGRFISADTIDPNLEDPQTFNRYSYTLNNPLKYIDPTGHYAVSIGAFDDFSNGSGVLTSVGGVGPAIGNSFITPVAQQTPTITTTPIAQPTGQMLINTPSQLPNQIIGDSPAQLDAGSAFINPISELQSSTVLLSGKEANKNDITQKAQLPFEPKDIFKNPGASPGSGWVWKGTGSPASGKGNWVKEGSKERIHPDLNHPLPKGPHIGYKGPSGIKADIFPDGRIEKNK